MLLSIPVSTVDSLVIAPPARHAPTPDAFRPQVSPHRSIIRVARAQFVSRRLHRGAIAKVRRTLASYALHMPSAELSVLLIRERAGRYRF